MSSEKIDQQKSVCENGVLFSLFFAKVLTKKSYLKQIIREVTLIVNAGQVVNLGASIFKTLQSVPFSIYIEKAK